MPSMSAQAKAVFDNTERYLRNSYLIKSRALIVKEFLGDVRHSRILDVGSGNGGVSNQFLYGDNHVTMLDLSAQMLERARHNTPPEKREHVAYVNANILDFTPDIHYDVVLCLGVLAYVDSVEAAIARVAELLRPGGRCILEINDSGQVSGKLLDCYRSLRHFFKLPLRLPADMNKITLPEVVALTARHNLKLKSVRRHLLLLPGMRRLPVGWLLKYNLFVLKHPSLATHGSEAILLCAKDG
jgi:ubiquinone/menaquinone biosynthesis C-methylase UbiE